MNALFDHAKAVVFDLDDTLLSYQQSEAAVLRRIFAENGIEMTQEALAHTWTVSWEEWDRLHLSETYRPEVAEGFHRLYREYLLIFFAALGKTYPFTDPLPRLAEKFIAYLGEQTPFCTGAELLLQTLASTHRLAIATNGLAAIQNPRLDGLPVAVERFISEEVGAVKPSFCFFEVLLNRLGLSARDCLFIGDSLSSDMAGAISAGMRTVWVNPAGRESGAWKPDLVVASLTELL